MRVLIASWVVLAAIAVSFPVLAGDEADAPQVKQAKAKAIALKAGESKTARVAFEVAKGYHVQANPASDEYLVATELALEPICGVTVGKIGYPKGEPFVLPASKQELSTYGGTFEVEVPITAPEKPKAASCRMKGTLRYQACDDTTCLFPASIPVEVALTFSR